MLKRTWLDAIPTCAKNWVEGAGEGDTKEREREAAAAAAAPTKERQEHQSDHFPNRKERKEKEKEKEQQIPAILGLRTNLIVFFINTRVISLQDKSLLGFFTFVIF